VRGLVARLAGAGAEAVDRGIVGAVLLADTAVVADFGGATGAAGAGFVVAGLLAAVLAAGGAPAGAELVAVRAAADAPVAAGAVGDVALDATGAGAAVRIGSFRAM
jgi:hypothetical protein